MPPLLIALAVAAVVALIPRKQTVAGAPTIVQTSPATTPPGITTSFAAPPIQSYAPPASAPKAPPLVANQPSPSSSGVQAWSSNAQEFNVNPYGPAPSTSSRFPPFYTGTIEDNIKPRYKLTAIPKSKTAKSSCGCGDSCGHGSYSNPSDCQVAGLRNRDGGCLAPTQRSLVNSAPPGVLEAWVANLASAGVNVFQSQQQEAFDMQGNNPAGEGYVTPAAPNIQGIGISRWRPIRGAMAG
jgi:hypothetical protein